MTDRTQLALHAFGQLRQGTAYRGLPAHERGALDRDLRRIAATLEGGRAGADEYAQLLGTPADLERELGGTRNDDRSGEPKQAPPPPPPSPPPAPPSTSQIGRRAAEALEAVNFPGFVAALVTGTFQAIVDATTQQIREYANLVASLSKTVDEFSRENVTTNQVRDWLGGRHPQDIAVVLPEPGKQASPQLLPRAGKEDTSPPWLEQYGLAGQALSPELTDGALIEAGRNKVGEERLQSLASLVLLGINRIVVSDGQITARLQFHAAARDTTKAEFEQQQVGIAARTVSAGGDTAMMVSTTKANAQADASVKADLMGEVKIAFRSETFPLDRFADSQAIQLLNRHARWKGDGAAPAAPAPAAPAVVAPATGGAPK